MGKALPALRSAGDGSRSDVRVTIPTGIEVVDQFVIGGGGLPGGRLCELFSDVDAGKTSFGFQCLGAAQRAGGVGILIETEKTLNLSRAPTFGVDLGDLLLLEPDTVEDVVGSLRKLLAALPKRSGPISVVWDSLAATELAGHGDTKVGGGSNIGKRARIMSEELPYLGRLAREHGAFILVINQLRTKIGVVFGNPETTPGGNALKFHSTLRLQLWKGATYKRGGTVAGITTTIKAVKNKVGLPFRKAKLRLDFARGWENEWSLLTLGKDHGVLPDGAPVSAENLERVRGWVRSVDAAERLGADAVDEEPVDGSGDPSE